MKTDVKLKLDNLHRLLNEAKTQKQSKVNIGVTGEASKYAEYIEFGWVQRVTPRQAGWLSHNGAKGIRPGSTLNNPPRPFMRDTFNAYSDEWIKIGKNEFNKTLKETKSYYLACEKFLKAVGSAGQVAITATIGSGGAEFGFEKRSPLTLAIYQSINGGAPIASGEKPLTRSNSASALVKSIAFELV